MGEGEMEETQKEVEQELADLDGQAQVRLFFRSGHFHFHKVVYLHFHFLNLLSRTVREETLMGKVKSRVEQTILALRDNSQHLPMKG